MADTRGRIVAAALQAFADRGYDGATTRDIARSAGVPQGLVTYHFPAKDDLWRAAMDHIFGLLREQLGPRAALLEEVDVRTRLRVLLRHFVRFAAAHPELHRLMIQEGKRDAPRTRWLVETHVRPLYEYTSGMIRALQEQGVLPRVAIASLHYLILGAVSHLFVVAPECRQLTGVDPLAPELVEAHADALVTLLLGRDAAPGERGDETGRTTSTG